MGRIKSIVMAAAFLTTSYMLLLHYRDIRRENRALVNLERAKRNNIKTILYWGDGMFGQKDFYLGVGSQPFRHCPRSNCYATYDKDYMPEEQFDAIIFHGREFNERDQDKPDRRTGGQRYVFFDLESPINTPQFADTYGNFYNWTMTYRRDSDIVHTYGGYTRRRTNYRPPSAEVIKQRPQLVAWMVSNCHTQSKREDLVDKLQRYLSIDVFGHCGDLSCPKDEHAKCFGLIESRYKFYLSFENSLCEDYVTEKLFNILNLDMVPIVYGPPNYTKIAPPHSVINVMDFDDLSALANYIYSLDAQPEAYLKYFDWKKDYVVGREDNEAVCQLCKKLNEDVTTKVYDDIGSWWRGKNNDKCTKPSW